MTNIIFKMKNKKTNLIYLCLAVLFILVPLKIVSADSPVPINDCKSNSALKECNWFSGQCPTGWKNAESPLGVSSFPMASSGEIQEKSQCILITPFTDQDFYVSKYKEGHYYRPLKQCKSWYPEIEINSVRQIGGVKYPDSCLYPIGVAVTKDAECEYAGYEGTAALMVFECLKSESTVPYLFCCPLPSCKISASSTSINSGDSVVITWSSENANSVVDSNNLNSAQKLFGSITKNPTSTTTYQLRVASSSGEQAICEVTVNIKKPPKPLPVISGPCQKLVPCTDDCKLSDIFVMIQNIVNCLVFISTIICLLFLVIGGLLYIFSLGNPENLTKAKNTILWALGGLALVFLAWLIVNTVMQFMGVGGGFLMWSSVG
jgi:hypothetical protein